MFTKSGTNNAIIVRLANVRKHPNADRLQLATVLGTQVIIGTDMREDDLVVYFDSNLRLSPEYIRANNLSSCPELNEDPAAKGYFPKTGRVRAVKLRGCLSSGFVASLDSLEKVFSIRDSEGRKGSLPIPNQLSQCTEGTEFTHIFGVEICSKYIIPVQGPVAFNSRSRRKARRSRERMETFWTHWDTKQAMRCLNQFRETQMVYVEEKIHGTSGRTGLVRVDLNRPWWLKWLWWLPREEWRAMSGTRRVDGIRGHMWQVRQAIEDQLRPHLRRGEQLYYEIFGYDINGSEIQKGFPYGCRPGEYKVMLYRVTITTPDGHRYDLDREQVYARARELGLVAPWKTSCGWTGCHRDTVPESYSVLSWYRWEFSIQLRYQHTLRRHRDLVPGRRWPLDVPQAQVRGVFGVHVQAGR